MSMNWSTLRLIPATLVFSIASGLLLTASPAAAAATPFEIVKGSWAGGGGLTLEGGKGEKLACTAYYASSGGGENLSIALRCAGQSKKFELRSHLNYNGGKVSGTWEERTFNASGDASGLLRPGSLNLNFNGGISGSMSVAFTSSSQSISFSIFTSAAVVKGVHVNLSRR